MNAVIRDDVQKENSSVGREEIYRLGMLLETS